jgi:branched-chain amino acid transport system substrate-binding protein
MKKEECHMKKGIILLMAAFLFLALGAAVSAQEKILFAIAGPMTGDSAAQGIQMRNGATIAVDEINAAGGISGKKLEYIVGDDVANPNQATVVAQKFASDNQILFILGHNNSGCSISALPIYQKAGLPVISPTNTNPTITSMGYKNYMRVIVDDDAIVAQQVLLAVKELGFKKPVAIWENTDYGKGMRDVANKKLKELNIPILADESYVPGVDRDYSAQATKFKGLGADVVLFMGEYTAGALFAKQAKNLGLTAQIVCGSGCSNPKLIEIAGPAAEGFWALTTFDPNDERPAQAAFIKKYTSRYKDAPGEWAAHSYDIVYLVKKAYEMGGTDRPSLIKKLHEVKAFPGVTGTIQFDEKGDVSGKLVMVLVVKGGKFTTYVPKKF